jgi:uncharacterized damage-inducible protein DinB
MPLDVVTFAFRQDAWATDALLRSMEQLTPEQYTAPGCSGHGSIRDTFAHLISSQRAWIAWFEGTITISEAIRLRIPGAELPTVARAREQWAAIESHTRAYVEGLTEQTLVACREWAIPSGPSGRSRLWKLLLHVANHGTHTRGQIVAAIRRAGYNPGNVEMLAYVMSHPDG